MNEELLEHLVSGVQLEAHGYKRRGKIMYRRHNNEEIRYLEFMTGAYLFDGIYTLHRSKPEPKEKATTI